MRFQLTACLLLLFLTMPALAQVVAKGDPPGKEPIHDIAISKVKGIKILSSSFDPVNLTVKITFINDSVSRITAFQGRFIEKHADGSVVDKEIGGDLLVADDVYYQVEVKKRPWLHELWRHPVYPGETYTQEFTVGLYPQNPIISVAATYNVVVYSDKTAEVVDDKAFQTIISRRTAEMNREKQIAKIASDVQASQVDAPLLLLAENLRAEHVGGIAELQELQNNESSNQQTKLTQFITDHQLKAKILEESSKLKAVAQ